MSAPTDTPARCLPLGLVCDVLGVLNAHGLDARSSDVLLALGQLIRQTPVERGGRLLPDGTVERDS